MTWVQVVLTIWAWLVLALLLLYLFLVPDPDGRTLTDYLRDGIGAGRRR
jgi:hypothetical protein